LAAIPYSLEPGLALALLLSLLWWAVYRRGAVRLSLAVGRGFARALDVVAGAGLHAEYRSTARKRGRDAAPSQAARRFGDHMERVAQAATSLYARCRPPESSTTGGQRWLVALVATPIAAAAVLCLAPRYLPVSSPVRFRIAQLEARWLDVRAALGAPATFAPSPTVMSSARHPGTVSVRLTCLSPRPCSGWLALERREHRLHERYVSVRSGRQKIIALRLRGSERWIADHGQLMFRRP